MPFARLIVLAVALLAATAALAQKRYDTGASDTEIRIGNTLPYSGPASAFSNFGKTATAYFNKINSEGGIGGRKIVYVSQDDAYSPPKTVELTRKLVESDQVLLMFNQLGTATNGAVQKYLNAKGIPQLFIITGAERFMDPKVSPWTMAFLAGYETEGAVYAAHVLQTQPNAKIAMLYQGDDYGKSFVNGFKQRLGAKASQVVAEATYEPTDPSVDSQVITLKASGATVLLTVALPKQASQTIRKLHDLGWKPEHYLIGSGAGIGSTLVPAGLDKSVGIISANYTKDPKDPRWENDAGMKDYLAFMKQYNPGVDPLERMNVNGYSAAMLLVQVLRQCGDDLRRENIRRQYSNLKGIQLPMLLPGVVINTSPDDYRVIRGMQLERFDGQRYVPIGSLMSL
jgi:ABC-type branched-subunit amino acid transport system substrate-binding protein